MRLLLMTLDSLGDLVQALQAARLCRAPLLLRGHQGVTDERVVQVAPFVKIKEAARGSGLASFVIV